jgi:hypothetical protein
MRSMHVHWRQQVNHVFWRVCDYQCDLELIKYWPQDQCAIGHLQIMTSICIKFDVWTKKKKILLILNDNVNVITLTFNPVYIKGLSTLNDQLPKKKDFRLKHSLHIDKTTGLVNGQSNISPFLGKRLINNMILNIIICMLY